MSGSIIANQRTIATPGIVMDMANSIPSTSMVPNMVAISGATLFYGNTVHIPNNGIPGSGRGAVNVGWGHTGLGGANPNSGIVTSVSSNDTVDILTGTWARTAGTGVGTAVFFEPQTLFREVNHGLSTGSLLFYGVSGGSTTQVYAIPVTSDTFRLALSASDAQNGIAATFGQGGISFAPARLYLNVLTSSLYEKFRLELYPASAKSNQTFSINTPVQIDWTGNNRNPGIVAGLWVNSSTYYMMTIFADGQFGYSGSILNNGAGVSYGGTGSRYRGRIIIRPDRTIQWWMANDVTNPTYTLVFTQSALSANTPPMYFVAGFCLQNQRIENCRITYL